MIVLYQYNEAVMREPYESKLWDKWRQLLPIVHYQAETTEGYLGRYHGENDVLGYIAPRWPEEPLTMGNLSAWRSIRALKAFTFTATHGRLLGHRSLWFEPWPYDRPHNVLWWGEADIDDDGNIHPRFDLDVAMLMQAQLGQHGPSSEVFTWPQ